MFRDYKPSSKTKDNFKRDNGAASCGNPRQASSRVKNVSVIVVCD